MPFDQLKRREVITLLGGAATWPLGARAQEPVRAARIAMLVLYGEGDPVGQARVAVFREALQRVGWFQGRNLAIDFRWSIGDPARAQSASAEMVARAPDLIVANGTAALAALHRVTRSIPIVFITVTDPVGSGYVQSLSRPGGNVTGFSTFEPEIGEKWLELLKELAPTLRRVAGILDPGFKGFSAIWRAIESMASKTGLQVATIAFREEKDHLENEVAKFAQEPGGALIVFPTAINNAFRSHIIALAARFHLPAIYPFRNYTNDGGLICYGFDSTDIWRRSAAYVDRILRGEKPADLPVQAPTKYELVINLKTARALRLEVPPTLLARADEIIE